MPPCPIAIPSQIAMVLNSLAIPPCASTWETTSCPRSLRWTCPGTNWVKEFTTATTGLPKSLFFTPVACHNALAPAIFLPDTDTSDRYLPMCPHLDFNFIYKFACQHSKDIKQPLFDLKIHTFNITKKGLEQKKGLGAPKPFLITDKSALKRLLLDSSLSHNH